MFRRKPKRPPWLRISAGRMQDATFGRLPEDLAEGGGESQPAPEYIAEASTPSEDAWERERQDYREKYESSD
jgi:hypothetical protein